MALLLVLAIVVGSVAFTFLLGRAMRHTHLPDGLGETWSLTGYQTATCRCGDRLVWDGCEWVSVPVRTLVRRG